MAATGKSYLCEDTTEDPLYLPAPRMRKARLTVPLLLHDEVIGTFNVESPEPRRFPRATSNSWRFSAATWRRVNTLESLAAEKVTMAAESVEAIHSAVALPVDEILNDAVNVMERYSVRRGGGAVATHFAERPGHEAGDPEVGQKMAPARRCRAASTGGRAAAVAGRRILVVDADGEHPLCKDICR